jgi:phage baseplate assembly protein W
MAEAQYEPSYEDLEQIHDSIPAATPGAVASKFDQNVVVGIDLPFVPDAQGQFKRNYSQLKQAKANLVNLLLTRMGERLNHPTFGSTLWNIIFEPNNAEILKEDIEESILNAVSNWMQYILIKEIIITEHPEDIDRNILKMRIKFSLRDDIENFEDVFISVNENFGIVNDDGENQELNEVNVVTNA